MTRYELTARIEVLEERVERLAGALIMLLEAIHDGEAEEAVAKIREVLRRELEPPQ